LLAVSIAFPLILDNSWTALASSSEIIILSS
jgi:hypothetical protein